jgi:thioredoxin 1
VFSATLPIVIAVAALAAVATPASAAEIRDFDAAGFAAAQAAGRPILVDVRAWWCPVCASQNHTIKQAVTSPAYAKLLILEVNYDKQKAAWQVLGVHKQGTLIGYHGRQEVGRLEFRTDAAEINALLAKTAG